jgi:methylmalonyl-CoA carboxyltransferase small subunit
VKLKITVDGKIYEVEVEASEPEAPPFAAGYVPPQIRVPAAQVAPVPVAGAMAGGDSPVADERKVCRTPIAGTVVRITAKPGQRIQTGDVLLVLEAMKMETNLTSPTVGKVARILCAVGESVQGGKVLVELE